MGDGHREEELYDIIQDLEDEKKTLKEAIDDLMEENEKLRKELKEKDFKREVK